jgi:hypothetical protein
MEKDKLKSERRRRNPRKNLASMARDERSCSDLLMEKA